MTASALKRFKARTVGTKTSNYSYRFIQSESDLQQEIELSASGTYNIEGVDAKASASYLNKVRFSETSLTLIATYESQSADYELAEPGDYVLTDEAKRQMADPRKFRETYGDYFIAGPLRGSRFTALYRCQARDAESLHQFKASVGASAEVFSAESSGKFTQSAKETNVDVSVEIVMEGYEGTSPSGPWSPEKVLEALSWFKQNEKGISLLAYLRHYGTLNPDYPKTVDVDPAAFIRVHQLHVNARVIQSYHSSLPEHYRNRYSQRVDELVTGIRVSSSDLARDPQKLDQYQALAESLLAELRKVIDRRDFFLQVRQLVSSEPRQGEWVYEGQGQQIWRYGYGRYTKSDAVAIKTWEDRFHKTYSFGDTYNQHTFEFPRGRSDQGILIVGWELVSNWNDGTNGSFSKGMPKILLEHYAAIIVSSQFARGCDWTCRVYYVDAGDYEFS